MNYNLSIIKPFSKGLKIELTIHQISKLIKKSYAFTNKEARDYIQSRVLNKKVVGNAILCSLNFKNDLAVALLALNSIEDKEKFFKNKQTTLEKINNIINQIKQKTPIYSALFEKNTLTIICDDEIKLNQLLHDIPHDLKIHVIDIHHLKLDDSYLKQTIIYGFENFWGLIDG